MALPVVATNPNNVVGIVPARAQSTVISFVVVDSAAPSTPLVLTEGQELRISKFNTPVGAPAGGETEWGKGTVPANKVWKVTITVNITEENE